MQKIGRTFRFLILSAAFTAIALIATNALLVIHLQAHIACQACDHAGSHDDQQDSSNPHDHSKCPLCQILLGPTGKYLNTPQANAGLVNEQPSIACDIQSQLTIQHTPGVADARGPPVC